MPAEIKFVVDTKWALARMSHGGESLSKLKNFAYAIAPYTNAEIRRVWAIKGDGVTVPQKSGDILSIHHYAHIFFIRASDDTSYAFKLYSPNLENVFEPQPEGDLIVTPECGGIIAEAYSDFAGEKFTFDEGGFVG